MFGEQFKIAKPPSQALEELLPGSDFSDDPNLSMYISLLDSLMHPIYHG